MWKVIARIHLTVVLLQHVDMACRFEMADTQILCWWQYINDVKHGVLEEQVYIEPWCTWVSTLLTFIHL